MCFIVVQDDIVMHPAPHVSLGSTCRHISTFPPASGSCDVLSSKCLFSAISITFGFLAPTRPSDWPCSRYNPACFLLVVLSDFPPLPCTYAFPQYYFVALLWSLKRIGRPSHSFKERCCVIADSPTITLASLIDLSALRIRHVADL
jgi:hypothetical protein